MKRALFAVALIALGGCRGLNRLIDGPEGPNQPDPKVISSQPPIDSEAPDFGIPTPTGYTLKKWHGSLPAGNVVAIDNAPDSIVKVFVKDVGQWFIIGTQSGFPFWYDRTAPDKVQFYGQWVAGKEYCVYQYLKD